MTTLHARIFSILWLVIFAVITTAGFIRWGPETVRTDIEDLLPKQALETRAGTVLSHIAKSSAQDVWILVLHPDRTQAKKAVDQIRRSLETAGFKPFDPAAGLDPAAVHRALFPYRENFLTDKDRAWLESADDKALLARAMRILYRPIAPNSWRAVDDPLGLFENWIASQSSVDRFTIVDGRTAVLDDEKHLWFILQLKSESAVSAVDGQKLTQAIAQAQTAAKAATDDNLKVISAGIPLMSEEIAHQASSEATFIGTISALVIAALVLVFFARLVPLMQTLAVLGISIGCSLRRNSCNHDCFRSDAAGHLRRLRVSLAMRSLKQHRGTLCQRAPIPAASSLVAVDHRKLSDHAHHADARTASSQRLLHCWAHLYLCRRHALDGPLCSSHEPLSLFESFCKLFFKTACFAYDSVKNRAFDIYFRRGSQRSCSTSHHERTSIDQRRRQRTSFKTSSTQRDSESGKPCSIFCC